MRLFQRPGTALRLIVLTLFAVNGVAPAATSSANRPMLNSTTQAYYTLERYLLRTGTIGELAIDRWNPTAGAGSGFAATYTVAADGSGNFTTVQAAIDAASGSARVYIAVKPGTYRATVCVPANKPPITLYGTDSDAGRSVIVFDNAGPKPKPSGTPANACNPNTDATTYGTSGSTTFTVAANDFHAKNLTFSNDYVEETYSGSGQQAVALKTTGDRLIFDNVRVLGHQDSLYLSTREAATVARAYFKNSQVQGDVDFIFGRGTAVFDGCTITYLTGRKGNGGNHIAPSTAAGNPFGFLFVNSRFTHDGASADSVSIGRSWDEGVAAGTYRAGVSPNGQALIRESTMDGHIKLQTPWGTSTSGRVYSPSGNRFREYQNTGAGS
ncbi:pectinesterase family protein [Rhizobacter sp. Root1221]|uniref:pectinesterase family protein n=1 Tax=Rhizobacter sp. Root1221 TaxID=1736433 RepID=UPI0006F44CD5|nr:pectinesterase family protein [Rhizobacter sp. Root1221]KQV96956.1 hypothetical protein ASC87_24085 [Rhizobacter sp. Root1221]